MNTTKFSLNSVDWKKIGMHFLIVAVSGGITYLLSDVVPTVVTGVNAALYITVISTILKGAQRFLSEYN